MSLSYEEQRIQNIKDNQALLLSLGLEPPSKPLHPKKTTKATSLRKSISKRPLPDPTFKPTENENDDDEDKASPAKVLRRSDTSSPGLRRSSRVSGISIDYSSEGRVERGTGLSSSPMAGRRKVYKEDDGDGEGLVKQRNNKPLGIRKYDPKMYGHIPDVEVGKWWASRMDCSTDSVHAPTVAGISGNTIDGAYSVALSGGYPDDVDLGVAFTYTGCGGRDLKGTKQNPKNLRTAPQTFDQSFDWSFNAALKRSVETRKPVRVIRGFKLHSPYAPLEGYRYDGLYIVEKAWMGKGLTKGLKVCRYAFKRMAGQPDLVTREMEEEDGDVEGEL